MFLCKSLCKKGVQEGVNYHEDNTHNLNKAKSISPILTPEYAVWGFYPFRNLVLTWRFFMWKMRDVIGQKQCVQFESEIAKRNLTVAFQNGKRKPSPSEVLDILLLQVWGKLPDDWKADPDLEAVLELTVEASGEYSTYLGDVSVSSAFVPGMICLTGSVFSCGRVCKLYTRFISRPFWQYVPKFS